MSTEEDRKPCWVVTCATDEKPYMHEGDTISTDPHSQRFHIVSIREGTTSKEVAATMAARTFPVPVEQLQSQVRPGKRTATMYLGSIKDPDGWQELLFELIPLAPEEQEEWDENHPNEKRRQELSKRFFEFGEYANVELVFDENLNIVGGRLVPLKK
jgi:hypothetical protein